MPPRPPRSTLFLYTTLFRSRTRGRERSKPGGGSDGEEQQGGQEGQGSPHRSEEHTSELQSLRHLVCRLLLEKKKKKIYQTMSDLEIRTATAASGRSSLTYIA